jgi:hypothetical protein
MREKLSLQERKLLEHHETELCSPSHRFGPTVRIELGENGGDVKLGGVEGDSQPTCESQQQTAATTKVQIYSRRMTPIGTPELVLLLVALGGMTAAATWGVIELKKPRR